jgi:RNA polymerase sigma-70 factor (sigma-E family)
MVTKLSKQVAVSLAEGDEQETGRNGHDADFTSFVQARGKALARTAFLIVGDAGRAEDALQTALAATYLRWGTLRRREAADAYVRQAIVTANAAWWRRRSNHEAPRATLPDRAMSDSATQVVERESLLAALRQLSPRQRAAVVLRYYDDLSERETAEIMGCSAGSVKKHASRGVERLRTLLTHDPEPSHHGVRVAVLQLAGGSSAE